jgi:PTH2 family peptidyl-tRNA hydrolase
MSPGGATKQVVAVRSDLGLGTGKLAAQVAHAALNAADNADPAVRDRWLAAGGTKVVVKAPDEPTIRDLASEAQRAGLPFAVVDDAGRTQVAPGTTTAIGIGPADAGAIDRLTGDLSLY